VPALLSLNAVSKSFGGRVAVRDLSFAVQPGEIFGLLGPNGAGKTTTIRMALDLFKPDSGTIEVFGGPMDDGKKDRIGYMPEERGLYDDMKLADCLGYLGTLKGLSRREAGARVEAALKRFDLWDHRKKKIEKLSRGMAQKAQIIAATLHDPDLLIVDEPFANLDPVNIDLVKTLLMEIKARGKAIIMSSHQLALVEALCDRIVLIHNGERVVYGAVKKVKEQFAGRDVWVAAEGDLSGLAGVAAVERVDGFYRLTLAEGHSARDLFRALAARPGITVEHFEVALPSLDEIFLKAIAR
jgi:ABC-2 type transport system ATP-binding protein